MTNIKVDASSYIVNGEKEPSKINSDKKEPEKPQTVIIKETVKYKESGKGSSSGKASGENQILKEIKKSLKDIEKKLNKSSIFTKTEKEMMLEMMKMYRKQMVDPRLIKRNIVVN